MVKSNVTQQQLLEWKCWVVVLSNVKTHAYHTHTHTHTHRCSMHFTIFRRLFVCFCFFRFRLLAFNRKCLNGTISHILEINLVLVELRKEVYRNASIARWFGFKCSTYEFTHTQIVFFLSYTFLATKRGFSRGTERGLASSGVCLKCANWEYMWN